ncbi:TonB-dependent hemoglobin/transferrin/lactoferrin family receptor [Aurantimonas sp. VKM B-3413]|uniref:TonB-dependent hemoglobin/transferrin/lactoferrin family receptor n=1 Tax=Aurantimonas sp. VKM B-3413 TaxID=2779401 RepID=UPI001E5FF4DD|nr:TonB-dependent hemoglobin/transferrin/lactoferrin family receptor [Aurantimonas sp. VKM B-3413]MCB8836712.1 TonB-dependent hemoglobin/transferrin/lactoferrin family receptor [Aurantimonas sp. VKM B-3413]
MARYSRQLAGAASGLVISLVLTQAASAQQAATGDTSIMLGTVVIEGAEGEGAATDQPAPRAETVLTTRVTRTELENAQIFDADDISRLDPGVDYIGSTGSFTVRGLSESRVLTTIDGIRIPWLDDGARGVTGGSATFDFDTLSALDIVKGGDSSVFGGGALGGVIAVRTLNPEDLLPGDKTFGGLSRATFDSEDESWGVDQALAARLGDTYMLLQGGYRMGHERENQGDVGGYGATRSEPDPLDYDQSNVLVKLRQHYGVDQVFGITGELYDRENDIDARSLATATYKTGSTFANKVEKRQRISSSYELGAGAGAWLDAADLVVYWQRQELSDDSRGVRLAPPFGDYSRLSEIEETTYGLNGSVMKRFDLGGLTHKVSVGGEAFTNRTEQMSSGEDTCPPAPYPPMFFTCNFLHTNQADMPETRGGTFGLFIDDEIAITDRFRLTPGLRFDYYGQNPQETAAYTRNPTVVGLPADSSDDAISPKLRAEFDITENATIYGQWARGFRAPTASELYLSYGGPGTYLRIGNPDLEAETSDGIEVGLRAKHDSFEWSVSTFYNRYENFLDEETVDPATLGLSPGDYPFGITRNFNREDVEIYGLEASAYWQMTEVWHSSASLAAYVGRDINTGVHLNSVPAAKGIFNFGYDNTVWGGDAYLTVAASRDDVENDISKTPDYALLDLTVWWKPTRLEGLKLQAGVYNVFDETYYDTLDLPDTATQPKLFYSEPGRSIRAAMTYQF